MKSKINNFLEYLPFLINKKLSFFLTQIGELEDLFYDYKNLQIIKPIFICGLARSGTTAVLNLLNNHSETGSFENQDLPFIKTLFFWNKINTLFYKGLKQRSRIHGDGLLVDQYSPESLEEIIWKDFLEEYNNFGFFNFLDAKYFNQEFENHYTKQIKKILKVRGNKKRYLSKGNYNIFRVKYIKKLFPDSKIIICFRDPIELAISSAKVHQVFLNLSKENSYFDKRLNIMCHYEFGKFRKTVAEHYNNFDNDNFNEQEYYYLKQWHRIYNMVINEYKNLDDVIFIDNKTFFEKPFLIKKLFNKLELEQNLLTEEIFFSRKTKFDDNKKKDSDLYKIYNQLKSLEQKTLLD